MFMAGCAKFWEVEVSGVGNLWTQRVSSLERNSRLLDVRLTSLTAALESHMVNKINDLRVVSYD
ncbi:hypothetical protein CY658_11145 [Variovorax sp. RO1]|nr:hypothetical protein CY658_11145 [Variovorax sp. RO1]